MENDTLMPVLYILDTGIRKMYPNITLCFFNLLFYAGQCLPCGVGLNVIAHVPPFEYKKDAWFTICCSMRFYVVILTLKFLPIMLTA